MNNTWSDIADCLRREIAEYGALYGFYEEQQTRLFKHDAEAVLRLSGDIEVQVRVLHDCRREREAAVSGFANAHGQPTGATIRSLLPLVPADARPLLEALVNEINVLIHRLRRISRHNHMLLARKVELQQQMLRQMLPGTFSQTYSPKGRLSMTMSSPMAALRTTG